MTDGRPVALCDGHDLPRLVDESIPGVAAVVDNVVEGFENPIGEPILTHELPDIFLAVQAQGRAAATARARYWLESEFLRTVPAGLVEDHDGVGARRDPWWRSRRDEAAWLRCCRPVVRERRRCRARTDRPEQIGRLGALVVNGARPRALAGPAGGESFFCPTRISS